MKRLLFGVALAAAAFGVALLPGSVAAEISPTQTTQVILSCGDGHSVILWAGAAELTSLTEDVQALNASGSNCSMNTSAAAPTSAAPSTMPANWTVYDYNPSGQAIAPRNSPNSDPATTTGTTTTFDFLPEHFTALLTTTDKSLTGDLSAKTLEDKISVNGPATIFMTQHNQNCTSNVPGTVRFYFVSPSASGPSIGTSPPGTGGTTGAGFYTRFWWSNPISTTLTTGNESGKLIKAKMNEPALWSDWNGKRPIEDPSVMEAFEEAIREVQTVGLSFGGTCFFETGVQAQYPAGNPPPPEVFSSEFSESPRWRDRRGATLRPVYLGGTS
jgi:hypothetical protein